MKTKLLRRLRRKAIKNRKLVRKGGMFYVISPDGTIIGKSGSNGLTYAISFLNLERRKYILDKVFTIRERIINDDLRKL